jgi:hypothetical protein
VVSTQSTTRYAKKFFFFFFFFVGKGKKVTFCVFLASDLHVLVPAQRREILRLGQLWLVAGVCQF